MKGKTRCKLHGGKSTGPKDRAKAAAAKKGNTYAATPGSKRSKYLSVEQQKLYLELQDLSEAELMRRAALIGVIKAELGEVSGINAAANAIRAKVLVEEKAFGGEENEPGTISAEPLSEEQWQQQYGDGANDGGVETPARPTDEPD